MGIRDSARIGGGLGAQVVEPVALVGRDQAARIGHRGELIERAEAQASEAGGRISHTDQPVQGIVADRGYPTERIGDLGEVAGGIVLAARDLSRRVARPDHFGQAIERVVLACPRLRQRAARVEGVFLDAVAGGIQGIGDAVAHTVGHRREPVRGIVAQAQIGAVRKRGPGQLACRVVLIGGELPAHVARDQALAYVIGERGLQPVRIHHAQRLAVHVVVGDLGDMAERIGERSEHAAPANVGIVRRVVGVGDAVRDIGARAIDGGKLTVDIERVRPRSRTARGGIDHAASNHVAAVVVAHHGLPTWLGNPHGQPIGRMPFNRHVALRRRARAFGAGRFQVPCKVVAELGPRPLEVGDGRQVAIGIVGPRPGADPAGALRARLSDPSQALDPKRILKLVGALGRARVGHIRSRCSPVDETDAAGPAGILTPQHAASGIVPVRREPHAVLIDYPGQRVRADSRHRWRSRRIHRSWHARPDR